MYLITYHTLVRFKFKHLNQLQVMVQHQQQLKLQMPVTEVNATSAAAPCTLADGA